MHTSNAETWVELALLEYSFVFLVNKHAEKAQEINFVVTAKQILFLVPKTLSIGRAYHHIISMKIKL